MPDDSRILRALGFEALATSSAGNRSAGGQFIEKVIDYKELETFFA